MHLSHKNETKIVKITHSVTGGGDTTYIGSVNVVFDPARIMKGRVYKMGFDFPILLFISNACNQAKKGVK